MLFDATIRFLAGLGLTIIINADGITTSSVVMSICVILLLEISLLLKNAYIYSAVIFASFIGSLGYLIYQRADFLATKLSLMLILACFTFISIVLYEKMTKYMTNLHRTRDDSIELESILKDKNRKLLSEQDQQVHMATLAERNRIAREIHDNVGHLLSRAILLLGAISTVNRDESLAPQLKMLADTLDESMEKMRSSVHDLHDDSIDLKKNMDEIIAELKEFNVNTELDLNEALPTEIKLSIIGILKEAVTNILKHSNGDTVSIILHENYNFCTLSVTDNGTLTAAEKNKISVEGYDGIGLSNIKNRAISLGGDAYIYLNDGFTVFARLPFEK